MKNIGLFLIYLGLTSAGLAQTKRENFKDSSFYRRDNITFAVIKASPRILVSVPKGTQLFPIEKGQTRLTSKSFISFAYEQVDSQGLRYLIGPKGDFKYKAPFQKLEKVERVIDLHENPHYFKPVPPKPDDKRKDKEFLFVEGFKLGAAQMSSSFFDDFFPKASKNSYLFTPGLFVLAQWDFPIQVGVSLDYELIKSSSEQDYIGHSLLGGFLAQYPMGALDLELSYRSALYGELIFNDSSIALRQEALSVFATKKWKSFEASNFHLGVGIEQKWFSILQNESSLAVAHANYGGTAVIFVMRWQREQLW